MMIMSTGFTERVQSINYSSDKNVMLIGSRDGKFRAYKVPNEWRMDWVE